MQARRSGGKRANTWAGRIADTVIERTLRAVVECTQLATPANVFHMDSPEDRMSLISALWSDDILEAAGRFTAVNAGLAQLFADQSLDGAEPTDFRLLESGPRFEDTIRGLFRSRSTRHVPLETAALSIQWLYYKVPGPV